MVIETDNLILADPEGNAPLFYGNIINAYELVGKKIYPNLF